MEASIKKSEGIIDANDKRIAEARKEIRKIEKEIAHLQDLADKLRGKYTALEIKVERLRTDISVAEAKEDKINAEIDRNIDRINFEKKKIAQDELDDLRHMIKKLKELVPTTENEIDRHYYNCYGDGSVQVEKTGSLTVYIVRGESLGPYLHKAYGKSVKVPALKRDIPFHKVDIFGPAWTNKFGYPFVFGLGMHQASILASYAAHWLDPVAVRSMRIRFRNVYWPGEGMQYGMKIGRKYIDPQTGHRPRSP